MATGWVDQVTVYPHPFVKGNVDIKCVASNSALLSNATQAAAKAFLQAAPYNMGEKEAERLIRNGRENRGRTKGTGYVQTYESNPI